MDHMRILRRAWDILWSYRALWVIGFILAVVSGGGGYGGGSGSSGGSSSGQPGRQTFNLPPAMQQELQQLTTWLNCIFSPQNWPTILNIIIVAAVFFVLLIVVFTIVRYVAETSIIRMVNNYEATGEKVGWTRGWRLGWSRSAWRLFLTDLLIFVPVILVFMILFGCAALPLLLNAVAGSHPGAGSIISTIGLGFLALFLALVVGAVLSLVVEIIYRKVVLAGQGPVEAIREGLQLVRRRFKDVGIMWLILIGVNIGYGLVMLVLGFFLFAVALLVGGGAGVALFFTTMAISGTVAGIVAAVIGGGLIFMLVLGIPITFLGGLKLVYVSSAWTLAYRELNVTGEMLPALAD